MQFLLFVVQIFLLFFLSQELTKTLSRLFYALFRSQKIVIHILSFLFLPGVVVHELSHLLVANIFLVPTGEVEFLPEVHENEVKMGSVAIGKTDPLRRFCIGAAPLVVGLGIVFIVFWYFYPIKVFFSLSTLLLFYIIFQLSNTMFSSRKDMEGALGLLAALLVLGMIFFLLGGKIPEAIFLLFSNALFVGIIQSLNVFLFVATILDSVVILLCRGVLRMKILSIR